MSDLIEDGTDEAGYPPSVGIYTLWRDSQMSIRIFEKYGNRRIDKYNDGRLIETSILVIEKDLMLSIDYRSGGIQESYSFKKAVRMADGAPPKRKRKVKGNSMINWHDAGTCVIDDRECRVLEWKRDGWLIRRRFVDLTTNFFRREITFENDGSILDTLDWIMEDENPPSDEVFTAEWKPMGYEEP